MEYDKMNLEEIKVLFMRRPVQRKYAAKAAHGSRGE